MHGLLGSKDNTHPVGNGLFLKITLEYGQIRVPKRLRKPYVCKVVLSHLKSFWIGLMLMRYKSMDAKEVSHLLKTGQARLQGSRLVMAQKPSMAQSKSTTSKYGNKKTKVDGKTFDSKKEAAFYQQLKQDPSVTDIKTQVRFELIPKQDGERACFYVADFVVTHTDGNVIVYDVKGMKTDVYRIKKKLMLWVHGIVIREV